jgi:hypothetical protein
MRGKVRGSAERDRSVLSRAPASNVEERQLRQVQDGASSHGGAKAPHGLRPDRNSRDRGDDESSKAIRNPENPQRPNADHLTGLIGSPCEMKLWSGPYGDVGRSAETTGPLIAQMYSSDWL